MVIFDFTDEEVEGLVGALKDETTVLEMDGEPIYKERYEFNKLLLKRLGHEYVEDEVKLEEKVERMKNFCCIKCGCTFDEAMDERDGFLFKADMKDGEWVCGRCDHPEVFESEEKSLKFLEDNGMIPKCSKCGNKMETLLRYRCRCEIGSTNPDPMEKTCCIKRGCTFNDAAYIRGGVVHDPKTMKRDEWICGKCNELEDY